MSRPRMGRVPEKAEQAAGVQLLRAIGASVYVLGTVRRRGDYQGTMQTPGIADVEAFLPAHGPSGRRSDGPPLLLKWECKAADGRLSDEQVAYRSLCRAAGVAHVDGTCDDLMAWLIANRYLKTGR